MRYIVLDLETTGLDVKQDRITELGYVLYEEGRRRPLQMFAFFINQEAPLSQDIKDLTDIRDEDLVEFGRPAVQVLEDFVDFVHNSKAEFFAGHNAIRFDWLLLKEECLRHNVQLPQRPWLDTKIDLPLDYKPKSTSLSYMAADHQFLNPFPHMALTDVFTCGRLITKYLSDKLLAIINHPVLEVRAVVSFHDKEKAKQAGFYWDAERKYWVKSIRACNLPQEQNPHFQVVVTDDSGQ